jgi:hypothetical protein
MIYIISFSSSSSCLEREREMGTKEEEKCGCNGGGRCKAVWFA